MYPQSMENLIKIFKQLPGIGEKTAERLAFSISNYSYEDLTFFSKILLEIRDKLKKCEICGNLCDNEKCNICLDSKRNSDKVIIVEKAKDIFIFEKLNNYNGRYHVLNGLISPVNGIGPDDLNINKLIDRISLESIKEIIIALKPSLEGEMTTQYIKKILGGIDIKISKIAIGIPMGTDMEYVDAMTLSFAFEDRKDI